MDSPLSRLRGLILVGLFFLPAGGAAQEPGSDAPLALLTVADGGATVRSLSEVLAVPDAVPAEARLGLGLAWLGSRARTGRSPLELVELLMPGPAALALVAPAGGAGVVFLTEVQERQAVDALLDQLAPDTPRRWRGDVLALAGERRLLDSLPASGGLWSAPGTGVHLDVDLRRIRAMTGDDGDSLSRTLDGAGRYLLGPWVRIWEKAERLVGELEVTDGGIRLQVELDATLQGDPWQKLTARGETTRQVPAPPDDTIALVSLDRQFAGLFRNLGQLLSEEDVANARTFLSIADQFLLGASFVDDLLGSLAEPIHLYVIDAEHRAPAEESPRVQLPAFALVASVPEESIGSLSKLMEQAARSLMIVINGERNNSQQAPFRLGSETIGELRGISAAPMPWMGPGTPPTEHGISPVLLFGQGHAILSTSRGGAMALAESLAGGRTIALRGDHLEVSGPNLANILRRNRSSLELERILDEGETTVEARRYWDTALAVLDAVELLRVQARSEAGKTELELELRRR